MARSLHLRYREALGESVAAIPEGFIPAIISRTPRGRSSRATARNGSAHRQRQWLAALREFAVAEMMALIRADLAELGVRQDVFTSERALVASGAIEDALRMLEAANLVYVGTLEPPKGMLPEDWEPVPLTLFRASQFGDDVDRPLKKSDGSWTYFAADMAYHLDKVRRGFAEMIDVWGADHGGYVKRMQAAVKALTNGAGALDVKLCQLVNLFDRGEPVRMSKRAGTFVTLREVVEQVGKDVFRFVMLTRRNDQPLDFDFAKVVEQSKDNPVFYVQYAHARASSVLRNARETFAAAEIAPAALAAAPLERLIEREEIALIRHLANWPRIVEGAAEAHEPHRIAFYLHDLAAAFHGLWTKGKDDASLRFIIERRARADFGAARARPGRGVRRGVGACRVRRRAGRGDAVMSYRAGLEAGEPRSVRRNGPLIIVVLLLVMGASAAGLWAAWRIIAHQGAGGAVPLIRADERPVKVAPANPGGMAVPDQNISILNDKRPTNSRVEQLLPPPETPLPRPVPAEPAVTEAPPAAASVAAPAASAPPAPTTAPAPARSRHRRRADASACGGARVSAAASCDGDGLSPASGRGANARGGAAGMEPAEARARGHSRQARHARRPHRSRRARRFLSHRGRPDRRWRGGAAFLRRAEEPQGRVHSCPTVSRSPRSSACRAQSFPPTSAPFSATPIRWASSCSRAIARSRIRCGASSTACAIASGAPTRRC